MRENSLTLAEALKKASVLLQNHKEASILLCAHLNCDRIYLMTHEKEPLTGADAYFAMVDRRCQNEPIEYITQNVSFYAEEFYIAPGALIPRPETELLIDEVRKILSQKPLKYIAEIGTGSGIISIMLAHFFPETKIIATDISTDALHIARINAEKFGVTDQITFVETSYLEGINQNFDMIISNPPYIAEGFPLEKPLSHEPQNALFGGKRGDEILRDIIDIACQKKTKYLLCEMGYDQQVPLSGYMRQKGIKEFSFYKDYSGFDRGFVAKIKE